MASLVGVAEAGRGALLLSACGSEGGARWGEGFERRGFERWVLAARGETRGSGAGYGRCVCVMGIETKVVALAGERGEEESEKRGSG